jgi:hypothetical protein
MYLALMAANPLTMVLIALKKKPDPSRDLHEVTLGSPAFRLMGSATFCPYLSVGLALSSSGIYPIFSNVNTA